MKKLAVALIAVILIAAVAYFYYAENADAVDITINRMGLTLQLRPGQ